MDIHTRVVAFVNIVYGTIGALSTALGALAISGLAHPVPAPPLPQSLLAAGAVMYAIVALLAFGQAVAGVALLKGSRAGRGFVIAFAVFYLFSKPWGTVMGLYTLWALLRKQPAAPVEAG